MDKEIFIDEPILELQLSSALIDFFNRILPKGYSLQIPSKARSRHPKRAEKEESRFSEMRREFSSMDLDSGTIKRVRRTQSKEQPKFLKNLDEQLKKCYKILQQLKKHEFAEPFLRPVDFVALNIPEYPTIVKEPMDFSTIEQNFVNDQYVSANQFKADINKIWINSYKFNPRGSEIYRVTVEMQKYFKKITAEAQRAESVGDLKPSVDKRPKLSSKKSAMPDLMNQPMTVTEKRALGQNIRKLDPKHLMGVWKIVSSVSDSSNELLEFDIDKLPVRITRELQQYVRQKMFQNSGYREQAADKQSRRQGGGDDSSSFELQPN